MLTFLAYLFLFFIHTMWSVNDGKSGEYQPLWVPRFWNFGGFPAAPSLTDHTVWTYKLEKFQLEKSKNSFNELIAKGHLISKANCQAVNSSKKRTNEFVFTSMRRVFIRFLEEIEDSKKTFWNYLTFSCFSFMDFVDEFCLSFSKFSMQGFCLVYLLPL